MTTHGLLGKYQHFGQTLVQICQITVSQAKEGLPTFDTRAQSHTQDLIPAQILLLSQDIFA
jgi:hypothetical protein